MNLFSAKPYCMCANRRESRLRPGTCRYCYKPILEGAAEPHTLARAEDPEPSHLAAEEIVPHLGALQQAAVEAVLAHPGKTAQELADRLALRDPRTLNRRLGEVEKGEYVRRGEVRRCSITGRKAATWWPRT